MKFKKPLTFFLVLCLLSIATTSVLSGCGDGSSKGLYYEISDNHSYYILRGIGSCSDKDIKIASTYDGLPVKKIDRYALRDCESIRSIIIPDSVESIGNMAFYNCTSLTNVTIPDSVTSIGSYAFDGCTSLTNITIPNSVTSIGSGAFEDCSSLESINIPNSVTYIGDYAFKECNNLKSALFENPRGWHRYKDYWDISESDLSDSAIAAKLLTTFSYYTSSWMRYTFVE